MHGTASVASAALLALACRAPLPEPLERPDSESDAPAWLEVEPGSPERAPPVLRVRVLFHSEPSDAQTLELFQGQLSSYHLGRIARDDLPNTLQERIVSGLRWSDTTESGAYVTTFAPAVPLAAGLYSVASRELGLIGTITIVDDATPVAERIWPPVEGGVGAEHVIYCGGAALSLDAMWVELQPGASSAELRRGIGPEADLGERCVELVSLTKPDGEAVVPPPLAGGVTLDPAPLALGEDTSPLLPASCAFEEVGFGPGCARILDDRLIVRSADAPLLWLVRGPRGALLQSLAAGGRFVVLGFQSGVAVELDLWTYDLAGKRSGDQLRIVTTEPRPHIVINEVFANALGPEPAQEWLELYNDGQQAVELAGWTIEDVGGVTLLGAHRLEPGRFVLVAGEDYDMTSDLDIVPPSDTPLLRVPRLGKSGLSNSGERLLLRDPAGVEMSRFPALATVAGRSVARRYPHSLDDEAADFGRHAPPGASPGAANALEP